MKHTETHRLQVKNTRPPVVEVDTEAQAVYVRFRRAKVARTIDRGGETVHIAIDLDAKGEVIGIELIGTHQFNIEIMLKQARVEAPQEAVARTRYVSALMSSRGQAEELAHN